MFGPIATRDNVLAFARRMEELGYPSGHLTPPRRAEAAPRRYAASWKITPRA